MGYTHYWEFSNVSAKAWSQAYMHVAQIVGYDHPDLGNAYGDRGSEPEVSEERIAFNGLGDDAHETFSIPADWRKATGFNFCKTACKPYDDVVVACLVSLKHDLGKAIDVSSDGERADWDIGTQLARVILDDQSIRNPIK